MRHFGVLFFPYTTHMKCEDSHRDTSEIFLDRLNPMETTHSIYCAHSKFTECTILSELTVRVTGVEIFDTMVRLRYGLSY